MATWNEEDIRKLVEIIKAHPVCYGRPTTLSMIDVGHVSPQ